MFQVKEVREASDKTKKKIQDKEDNTDLMIRYWLNRPVGCPFFIPLPDGWYCQNPENFSTYAQFVAWFQKWLDENKKSLEKNKKNLVK